MAQHSRIVAELARAGDAGALAPAALAGALVHTADLASHALPRAASAAWTLVIADEFARQADAERAAGLAATPFFLGLGSRAARGRLQASFIGGVVAPLWRALAALADGALDEPLANVEDNLKMYIEERDAGDAVYL